MDNSNNIWKLVKTGFVEIEKRNPVQMLFYIGKMFLILLLIQSLSICLIVFVDWMDILERPENLSRTRFEGFTDIEILFVLAVFAPIMEELTYRLPLKFSKWNLIIASMGIILTFCHIILELEYVYTSSLTIGTGVFFYLMFTTKNIELLSNFWLKNKLLIFYMLLMIFSFLHLKNYKIETEVLLFLPIIVLPKIILGLFFSYIRLNSGILLAICFHMFYNGIIKVIIMIY